MSRRPSQLDAWPRAFDPAVELDWGDPVVSRRLLREHLDQAHDGASRRLRVIDAHVRRLLRLLPEPPADVLDAACGPGLYAVRLARAGHRVTALDIGPAVVAHARAPGAGAVHRRSRERSRRRPARRSPSATASTRRCSSTTCSRPSRGGSRWACCAGWRDGLAPRRAADRRDAPAPRPARGRISSWDVVDGSLLSDRRHLLLVETVHDRAANTFVLRETAVFDDGTTAVQQTSSALTRFAAIPTLFARAGLRVQAVYDGWSRFPATALSETVLVVARRR